MTDPLGLIGQGGVRGVPAQGPQKPPAGGEPAGKGAPAFRDVLLDNIKKVNQLQQEATTAAEDIAQGKRDDAEAVLLAVNKADTAFRTLLAVRNKVQQAYDEVKQIRV